MRVHSTPAICQVPDCIYKDNYFPKHNYLDCIYKEDDPKELGYGNRNYQIRCYNKFYKKSRTILIAPTGSGKSLVQVFNAAREIKESDYNQKQVFIVPQLHIAHGFTEYRHKSLKIDDDIYGWEVTENYCYDSNQSVKKITNFLLNKNPCKSYRANKILGGCTAAISYSALLAAFNKMTSMERKNAIKNVSFRIDEIHHISGVNENGEAANRLGEFTKQVLDNDGSLHLTTATFFRGDQSVIISNEYIKDFEIFRVPFLEHWRSLGLEELHQNYYSYNDGEDILQQIINSVASEPEEPPIVIVPSDGQKFFKCINKWKWVNKLVEGLGDIYGNDKVLDLVTPSRQQKDKNRLMSDNHDFSAVVTCAIGREGTDWPVCSRVYNTVLDGNALQAIQKLGRALRQSKDKINVKMINFIEHFDKWNDDPSIIREKLSDRFNTVVCASMLDDMFYPILMPTLPSEKKDKTTNEIFHVTLEDVYGSNRNELIEDMMRRVLEIPCSERTGEIIDEIINEIIEEYEDDNITKNVSHDVLKERLRKEILRRQNPNDPNLRIDGIIVDFIRENGWDKVVRDNIAPNSPFIGKAKTEDLEELQKFLKGDWMENMEQVKKIGIKNIKKGDPFYRFIVRQKINFLKQTKTIKD